MLEISTRLERGAPRGAAAGQLKLTFDARQKSRLRARLASGVRMTPVAAGRSWTTIGRPSAAIDRKWSVMKLIVLLVTQ